jgi:hypothetical protein
MRNYQVISVQWSIKIATLGCWGVTAHKGKTAISAASLGFPEGIAFRLCQRSTQHDTVRVEKS